VSTSAVSRDQFVANLIAEGLLDRPEVTVVLPGSNSSSADIFVMNDAFFLELQVKAQRNAVTTTTFRTEKAKRLGQVVEEQLRKRDRGRVPPAGSPVRERAFVTHFALASREVRAPEGTPENEVLQGDQLKALVGDALFARLFGADSEQYGYESLIDAMRDHVWTDLRKRIDAEVSSSASLP